MELLFFKSYEYNKNNDFPPFLEISRRWISVDFGHDILWNLTPRWWKNQLISIFRRVKTYFYPPTNAATATKTMSAENAAVQKMQQ